MRADAFLKRFDIFTVAALLTAHTMAEKGFRQRDVKFLIEMFSNWIDTILPASSLTVHNTQVMRLMSELESNGFLVAKKTGRQNHYQLNRTGILHLTKSLVEREPSFPLEQFYFTYHFIDCYRIPLEALFKSSWKEFPPSIQIELKTLLDSERLRDRYAQFVQREIKKLDQRIADSEKVLRMIRESRAKRRPTEAIIADIEKFYPYDLNSQKPLTEFYSELPETVRNWVLDFALKERTAQLWAPLSKLLKHQLAELEALTSATSRSS